MRLSSLPPWLPSIPRLCKLKITVSVAVTTAAGYILSSRSLNPELIVPMAGVFLLACGSSALNQIQEWRADVLMARTRSRPIPSGKISLSFAWAISLFFLAMGTLLLAPIGWGPLLLGGFSVFWYNGIYTLLKRRTALAVIPGALIGAIPPAIGWSAAGGGQDMAPLAALCVFLFLWQIPHFWLLALLYEEDYRQAGYPTIGQSIPASWVIPATIVLIALAGISGMILPAWGMGSMQRPAAWPWLVLPCIMAALALFCFVARGMTGQRSWCAFYAINGLGLAVVATMAAWALTF